MRLIGAQSYVFSATKPEVRLSSWSYRQEKSKLDALQAQLDQNDDKHLEILQPELKQIQERVSVTETQDLQNQQMAA
jgi:hypothetical protein